MELSGTFEFTSVDIEDVWLALSDPVLIQEAIPGCQVLAAVEDEDEIDFDALETEFADAETPSTFPEAASDDVRERAFTEGESYAAIIGVKVGPVNPTFESVGTVTKRDFPEMHARGSGASSNSSFEAEARMTLVETDGGVRLEWEAETTVFGKLAQMGQRMINPVSDRLVNRFFDRIGERIRAMNGDDGNSAET